jgi:hypothetical protein
MKLSLVGIMSVQIGKPPFSFSKFGRPLFKFELVDDILRISGLGCSNVATVKILGSKEKDSSFLLNLFLCEMESFDAMDESGATTLTIYRFDKQGFSKAASKIRSLINLTK